MTTFIAKLTLVGVLATVFAVAPVRVQADDKPAVEKKTAPKGQRKNGVLPFHGKLVAIDKTAKTIKVGERTFQITSETKLLKNEKLATLDDAVVGEAVGGAYRTADDGKLIGTKINFGPKAGPESGSKKKKATPAK